MKPLPVPKNTFLRFLYLMVQRYLRHRVGIQSAALAFYLLFSIFPFLIFISALLGLLQLNVAGIMQAASEVLPREVVSLMGIYLNYVGANSSLRLLLFGLLFSVYFPMRAANSLMHSVRTAYHLGPPRNAAIHWLKTFLYTVLLIAAIALTLILMTVGERFLLYAVEQFRLPVLIAELWVNLRFPVIIVVGYFALFFLYAMAQDPRPHWRDLWPGTLASLAGWVILNWAYAFYVNNIAQYSALYGSIGAVIVLLVWLNLSAIVLIMGAEMNGVLIGLRKDTAAA